MSPRIPYPELPQTNSGIREHLKHNPTGKVETALHYAEILEKTDEGKKRLYMQQGQLAKLLIETNHRAAQIVARVFAETPPGKKLLIDPPAWMKKLNSAQANFFAMGLAERLEEAAPLVAYNDGYLAEALFVNPAKPDKNSVETIIPYYNGSAKSLAPLLAATEEGKKILKRKLNGASFAETLYRADENVCQSVAAFLPKPSSHASSVTSTHSAAQSPDEKQR